SGAFSLSPAFFGRPAQPPVRVTVASEGRLVGKVAFADGAAVSAFTIGVGGTPPTSFVAKDGAFALPVIGGTHSIVVAGPGFVQKHVDAVVVAEGKDTDVGTISVTPGRAVSGRVLDETGAPVRGARVAAGALLTGGGSELYIKDESIDAKDTETDAHGRFSLDGFGPTALTVVAGKDGLGRSASARIPAGTESAALDLVLQPVAGLEGTITRSGAPAADTVVIANPIGAVRSSFFVTTGPDGKFVLDALAPGGYVVYPMFGEGGRGPKDTYVRRVEVALGKRAKVDIDGTPGGAALQVSIKTDQGGPVMMAQVIAMQTKIEAETLDQISDGTKLPVLGDEVIPTYIRQAPGGQVEVQGVRAGLHTVCAAPIGPATKMSEPLRLKCAPVTVGAAGKAKLELVVPAAWVEAK
ncbi:MAG: carboxypeptidase-like regulatory domain-containing protein, partial [Kofleriaceae bacterium]